MLLLSMHALAWKRFMSPNLLVACPCTQHLQLDSDGLPQAPARGRGPGSMFVRERQSQRMIRQNKSQGRHFVRRCAAHRQGTAHISYPEPFLELLWSLACPRNRESLHAVFRSEAGCRSGTQHGSNGRGYTDDSWASITSRV